MAIPVIVMGAAGRMGATLIRMIQGVPDLELAGVVERETHIHAVERLDCPCGTDVSAILGQMKEKAVVVDFTAPSASLATAAAAGRAGMPVVIGTTGFSLEERKTLEEIARSIPLFWSPNMSVGINVLLKILPELTKLLGEDYDIEMMEIHHNKKKDAPSGTALRLAESLAEARGRSIEETACYHREGIIGERPEKEIGIQTLRGGDVVGVHTVYFMGPGERIELTHQAHSRENFASGALRAVRWLYGQSAGKLYTMQDIF